MHVSVAYDSDLAHVERVTVEVARGVLRETPGGVADVPDRALATERVTIVLSRCVVVRVGSVRIEAGAGDFVPVRAGTLHGIVVKGDRPALLLHVSPPMRRTAERPAR